LIRRSFDEPPMRRAMTLTHPSTKELNRSPSFSKKLGSMFDFACWIAVAIGRPPAVEPARTATTGYAGPRDSL
jgi:hypothetical protein